VGNEEVLHIVKEEFNNVHKTNRKKYKLVGNILLGNRLIKHDIAWNKDGRLEVTERLQRRRKQLQDDVKESRGYWKLSEEAVDRAVWRTGFGKRLNTTRKRLRYEWMNEGRKEWTFTFCVVTYFLHQPTSP